MARFCPVTRTARSASGSGNAVRDSRADCRQNTIPKTTQPMADIKIRRIDMRTEEKKEPITVTYVGRGGVFDTPCYMDQNGRYYFDENNGSGSVYGSLEGRRMWGDLRGTGIPGELPGDLRAAVRPFRIRA